MEFVRMNNQPDVIPIENNPVNHPNHYTQGGIECIKAIEASMSPEGFQDYCKGNVQKYIWRWRDKNGLEDLKKAQVYLGWLIESVEKENVEDEHYDSEHCQERDSGDEMMGDLHLYFIA